MVRVDLPSKVCGPSVSSAGLWRSINRRFKGDRGHRARRARRDVASCHSWGRQGLTSGLQAQVLRRASGHGPYFKPL